MGDVSGREWAEPLYEGDLLYWSERNSNLIESVSEEYREPDAVKMAYPDLNGRAEDHISPRPT
jgi:hypothetical protein